MLKENCQLKDNAINSTKFKFKLYYITFTRVTQTKAHLKIDVKKERHLKKKKIIRFKL